MKEPDILDEASNLTMIETESIVKASHLAVLNMPKGEPGECIECEIGRASCRERV